MKTRHHATLTFATLLLMTCPVFAQELDRSSRSAVTVRTANSPSYGLVDSTSVQVQAFSFEAYFPGTTTDTSPYGSGSRFITSSGGGLLASGISLPNGALITRLEIQGCDSSATGYVGTHLLRTSLGDFEDTLASAFTSNADSPGCAAFFVDTNAAPGDLLFTVNNRDYSYWVRAQTTALDSTTSFQAVRVFYKLQMGPDPATSSFTDVTNVGTELHRAVENLRASGITLGCGDGTAFCPGNPVTRGQMAIFLARALGLHWPN